MTLNLKMRSEMESVSGVATEEIELGFNCVRSIQSREREDLLLRRNDELLPEIAIGNELIQS